MTTASRKLDNRSGNEQHCRGITTMMKGQRMTIEEAEQQQRGGRMTKERTNCYKREDKVQDREMLE